MYQSAFPDNWKHEPPLNVLDSPPILHCILKQKDRKKSKKTNNQPKPTTKPQNQTNKKNQTNKNKPTKTKVHFITACFSLFV